MRKYSIENKDLSIEEIEKILNGNEKISLSRECQKAIKDCRSYLEKKLDSSEEAHYGINTGFGSLCNVKIGKNDLSQLQENLILSHACGSGPEIPLEIVRLMLFLKIRSLSFGYSGIRLQVVEMLVKMYNNDILPEVFEHGSLGASGDLAPLAHVSLFLIGKGTVNYKGKKISSKKALGILKEKPIKLASKEGLALLNGTQFSLAFALWSVLQSKKILSAASLVAATSMDAFLCGSDPINANIHKIRKQKGQAIIAKNIRKVLVGSAIHKMKKDTVQDPYSFRCVPQVHGASYDSIDYVATIVEREFNSVTDNPNIFPKEDRIMTGGNFHAQPLALALDFLGIAISEIGSISERRTYQLISGERGLPDFLTPNPGLNSGLMITQYTAASIASQNKQLCTPASVDSIVSSKGQEDHVSMAANAATKTYKLVNNIWALLGIEYIAATQALSFRRPLKSSPEVEKTYQAYRKVVPVLKEDRLMRTDMVASETFLRNLK